MALYSQAVWLRDKVAAVGVNGSPQIVLGVEREPANSDRGPGDYEVVLGGQAEIVFGVEPTIFHLAANCPTDESKVKFIRGKCGITNEQTENELSNFSVMKECRKAVYQQWWEKGKPDTHIF